MPRFLDTKSLYYNDVNLIASFGQINSRKDIPKQLNKIIISPMDAVVSDELAIKALNKGVAVCLPRFNTIAEQKKSLYKIYDRCGQKELKNGDKQLYVSVGLNDWDRIRELNHDDVLIDVANGYLYNVCKFAEELRNKGYRVMVGNVHDSKGINLYNNYTKVRLGIGQGKVCKTGQVSGYTRGQITEILDCYNNRRNKNQYIVADGGICSSGCAVKAFAAGADYIMLGGYFSNAEEAKNVQNGEYSYWGGASEKQQLKYYGEIRRNSEGIEIQVDKNNIKPIEILIDELWDGIASGISYSGYQNLTQFIGNGVFEIKHYSGNK